MRNLWLKINKNKAHNCNDLSFKSESIELQLEYMIYFELKFRSIEAQFTISLS